MAKGKKGGKKKAGKSSSNVFAMFEQPQIQEFKEAFGMIDANRDGFIDKEDLRSTYASLGVRDIDTKRLEAMIAEAPAAINFTVLKHVGGQVARDGPRRRNPQRVQNVRSRRQRNHTQDVAGPSVDNAGRPLFNSRVGANVQYYNCGR